MRVLELDTGPQEEQCVLLTAESPLQPPHSDQIHPIPFLPTPPLAPLFPALLHVQGHLLEQPLSGYFPGEI